MVSNTNALSCSPIGNPHAEKTPPPHVLTRLTSILLFFSSMFRNVSPLERSQWTDGEKWSFITNNALRMLSAGDAVRGGCRVCRVPLPGRPGRGHLLRGWLRRGDRLRGRQVYPWTRCRRGRAAHRGGGPGALSGHGSTATAAEVEEEGKSETPLTYVQPSPTTKSGVGPSPLPPSPVPLASRTLPPHNLEEKPQTNKQTKKNNSVNKNTFFSSKKSTKRYQGDERITGALSLDNRNALTSFFPKHLFFNNTSLQDQTKKKEDGGVPPTKYHPHEASSDPSTPNAIAMPSTAPALLVSPQGVLCVPPQPAAEEASTPNDPPAFTFVQLQTHTQVAKVAFHGCCSVRSDALSEDSWHQAFLPTPASDTAALPTFSEFACYAANRLGSGTRHERGEAQDASGEDEDEDEDLDGGIGLGKVSLAGDHAALFFAAAADTSAQGKTKKAETAESDADDQGLFLSAAVLRCDTWAAQWAVGPLRSSSAERYTPCPGLSALLCGSLLCGVAVPTARRSTNESAAAVYVAVQPRIESRRERRLRLRKEGSGSTFREFIAPAHLFPLHDLVPNCTAPLAIAATSRTTCAILFASGDVVEVIVSAVQEPEAGAAIATRLLAHLPAVSSATSGSTWTLQVLRSTEDPTANGTVLAAFASGGKKSDGDGDAEALFLLPLAPPPQKPVEKHTTKRHDAWFEVKVAKGYRLRHAQFVYNTFPRADGVTSSLLLQLQQAAAPFTRAVQCGLILSDSTADGARRIADVVLLRPLLLPSASLELLASYYNSEAQQQVLVCGSAQRAKFFAAVKAGAVKSSSSSDSAGDAQVCQDKRKPNQHPQQGQGEEMEEGSLLRRHPESWLVTSIPYAEELGGYRMESTAGSGKAEGAEGEPANFTRWVPLLDGDGSGLITTGAEEEEEADDPTLQRLLQQGAVRTLTQAEFPQQQTTRGPLRRGRAPPPVKLLYALTHVEGGRTAVARDDSEEAAAASRSAKGTAVQLALFSVTVAPGLHTRLAKQWHNGLQGLLVVVRQALRQQHRLEASGLAARDGWRRAGDYADPLHPLHLLLAFHWHPSFLRRVLKYLSAAQLGRLLRTTCTFIADAATATGMGKHGEAEEEADAGAGPLPVPSGAPRVWFYEAADAATDVALQIVTLAKQKGLALDEFVPRPIVAATGTAATAQAGSAPAVLDPLLSLLRSVRALGHPLRRLLPRIEMVVEAGRQQRLVHTILSGRKAAGTSRQAPEEEELELHMLREVMDCLHPTSAHLSAGGLPQHSSSSTALKYTPSAWVTALEERRPAMQRTAEEAAAYLAELEEWKRQCHPPQAQAQRAASKGADILLDWSVCGRQPHREGVLRVFESGLIPVQL
eukprot:gene10001-6981_t